MGIIEIKRLHKKLATEIKKRERHILKKESIGKEVRQIEMDTFNYFNELYDVINTTSLFYNIYL